MLQALLSLTCWPNQHDAWSFQGPKTVYISSTFSGLSKKETHSGTHDKCSTLLQSQCWCLSPVMAGSMDIENGLDRNAQESAEDLKCGTETKSASQAIVGFSMAILAGPPTWYHMMLFCCSYCGTCVSVLWYCSETREAQDRNDTLQWFAEKVFCLAQPSTCQWTSRTVYSVKITANTSWTLQKTSFLSFFSREVLFFSSHKQFPVFVLRPWKLGHSFLPWLDEDDNMKHGQILLVAMTLVCFSRTRGAKSAIGFQKKVVSSANWKQAFDWIWTDWDRLGYFMEIFGCLGLCLFALYRYLSSGFDFPPRLCCDTEEAESHATPARSPFVGFRCDLGNCTSGMVPS